MIISAVSGFLYCNFWRKNIYDRDYLHFSQLYHNITNIIVFVYICMQVRVFTKWFFFSDLIQISKPYFILISWNVIFWQNNIFWQISFLKTWKNYQMDFNHKLQYWNYIYLVDVPNFSIYVYTISTAFCSSLINCICLVQKGWTLWTKPIY